MRDPLLGIEAGGQPINRRKMLAGGLAAALLAGTGQQFAGHAHAERSCCPIRGEDASLARPVTIADALQGNQLAMTIASRSSLVSRAREQLYALARSIPDDAIRAATLSVLDTPAPTYQLKSPSIADKQQVRQDLLDAGLVADKVTVEGIFPPVADANAPAQPIWSAPGSTYGGHHSYPGGLVVHEWVNGTLAKAFNDIYESAYGVVSDPVAIDLSISQAAPLWHDIHKTVIMQWNPDGSEFAEQTIADTGAHHPVTGAEAIVRGMSPDFVVAMLSAHDAPTNSIDTVGAVSPDQTGYQRLLNYIRAAAIIARVDPVAVGLLSRNADGSWALQQNPPRYEGYINHLSDHDFVLTGDSAGLMIKTLQQIAAQYGVDATSTPGRFNLFRNLVFSQVADMRLYGAMSVGGSDGVKRIIDREVDLSQLQA